MATYDQPTADMDITELFKVEKGQDPLGIPAYKKAHHIYTIRLDRKWTAFVSDKPMEHHIGLSGELRLTGLAMQAATESKAIERLARALGLPLFDAWKLAKIRTALKDKS